MATAVEEKPAIEALPISPERRKFTADEFEKMAEAGIIADQERVELIEGEIVVMSRIGSPHAACVSRLNRRLNARLGERVIVRIQDPIRLADDSEPEPDVVLVRPREDDYESGHPTPADVFLLIEVMDTSVSYDRNVKLPLYARSAIPEVWLTDIHGAFVESHRGLNGGIYTAKRIHRLGEQIAPEAFPDAILRIDEIVRR